MSTTGVHEHVRPEVSAKGTDSRWAGLPEHLAVALALGSVFLLTARSGGRETALVPPAVLSCIPACLVTRPWRRLPAGLLLLLALLPTSALVVSYVTPTQFAYSRDLGVWSYGALLAAAIGAYAGTAQRRLAVVLFLCVLGFYEFFEAFVPWFAGGMPSKAMVGTFYQQDMFGGFCAAAAVVAVAVVVLGSGLWRSVGAVVAPVCIVGTVLSTSRAAIGLVAIGVLTVGALALRSTAPLRAFATWVTILLTSVGMLFFLTSTLVFPDEGGGSPVAGTTGRSGSDSLGSSSQIRQAYWRAAISQFQDAPLTGEGFGSYGLTFFERAPIGAFGSRYAHNGVLQGLGEGGLLFGLPLLLLSGAVVSMGVAQLARFAYRRRDQPWSVPLTLGALVLLGHSLVDFDWSFPALAAVLAVSSAAAFSPGGIRESGRVVASGSLISLLVLASLASAYAVFRAQGFESADTRTGSEAATLARRADGAGLPNPLLWSRVLANSESADGNDRARALRRTERLGRLDPTIGLLRARVLIDEGRTAQGLDLARATVSRTAHSRPDLLAVYAEMLALQGQDDLAARLLSDKIKELSTPDFASPANVWRLVEAVQAIRGRGSRTYACAYAGAAEAFGADSRPATVPEPASLGAPELRGSRACAGVGQVAG